MKHFIITVITTLIFSTAAIAQENDYEPQNFLSPLTTNRGQIIPASPDGLYLEEKDRCNLLKKEFGWTSCNHVEQLILNFAPGLDTILVNAPNSEGYIQFDDWDKNTKEEEIQTIWNQLVDSSKAQSEKLGEVITPLKWYIYPTLNKEKSYLYYAILIEWNGEKVLNIRASLFDRKGYIPFEIIPSSENLSGAELQRLIEIVLSSYQATGGENYADFKEGEKIAAAGAMGVLATLVGVKFGKIAAVGLGAMLTILAKKAGVFLLLPFLYLGNLFKRKKKTPATISKSETSTEEKADL